MRLADKIHLKDAVYKVLGIDSYSRVTWNTLSETISTYYFALMMCELPMAKAQARLIEHLQEDGLNNLEIIQVLPVIEFYRKVYVYA